jgi:hypothetical protein
VNYWVILDESAKAEAFPSHKGSQAASAQRDRVASADPAPRKPQAQAPQAQETRIADSRRGCVMALSLIDPTIGTIRR